MKEKEENKDIPLSELGKVDLIHHLTDLIQIRHNTTLKGVGDDAAVLGFESKKAVVSSDMFAEGVHFNLVYTPLMHLGYKAIVAGISDIYAMNATPKQVLINLALSSKFTLKHVDELYQGFFQACEVYSIDIIGGDITSSVTGLIISITAIGEAEEKDIVYRSGAKANDIVCVSGNLGGAYMGLQVLERERRVFESTSGAQPKLDDYRYIIQRQLKPEARKEIPAILKELNVKPTSMIDISTGLASEVMHICAQSKTGCKLFAEKIPVDDETAKAAEEMNLEPLTCALNGGEDYELLFTIDLNDTHKVSTRSEIRMIGHLVADTTEKKLIFSSGAEIPLKAQGWNEE